MRYLIIFLFLTNFAYGNEVIINCEHSTTDFTRNGKLIHYKSSDFPHKLDDLKYKINDRSKKLFRLNYKNKWVLVEKREIYENFKINWSDHIIEWSYEETGAYFNNNQKNLFYDQSYVTSIDRLTGDLTSKVYFGENSATYKRDGTSFMKQKFKCKNVKNKF